MAIRIKLDEVMKEQGKTLTELAGEIDITLANLSILKNNKARAVRFTTLDALCRVLHCQPGDILEYRVSADEAEIPEEGEENENKDKSHH